MPAITVSKLRYCLHKGKSAHLETSVILSSGFKCLTCIASSALHEGLLFLGGGEAAMRGRSRGRQEGLGIGSACCGV